MSLFLSNASSNLSYGGFSPDGAFILIAWPPQLSIKSASLVLNSPLTGITALSPFLIRLTTDASTAPVPEVVRSTISFEVWKTFWVFSTIALYSMRKSSLLWFIKGASIAFMTLLGTFVGPGSITRYSIISSKKRASQLYLNQITIMALTQRFIKLGDRSSFVVHKAAPFYHFATCSESRGL